MFGEAWVTRTKFLPPRARRTHLARARLHAVLADHLELPLTLVVAGTGYGKTSLIAGFLAQKERSAWWYALGDRDADPQVFALHLAHLVHRHHPSCGDRALELLQRPGGASKHGLEAIEALADALLDRLEAETWWVFDDVHLLQASRETLALINHLVAHLPPRLHVVLISRVRPELPDLPRWRLQGQVLSLEQADLAFLPSEITDLFRESFRLDLDPNTLASVVQQTEGWPMALPLLAERMQEGLVGGPTNRSLRDLFDYLAREVLGRLEQDEQDFLLATAVLSRLDAPVCDALLARQDASSLLARFNERGLFLVPLEPGAYRHHHLFREFLLERLAERGKLAAAHRSAARAFLERADIEEAIEHLLAAGDHEPAAACIAQVAPTMVDQGRYGRLEAWLERLHPVWLDRAPALCLSAGDMCRLTSRFEAALGWYDRALAGYGSNEGKSRAFASKALIYLDTVQPALAERLLEEALACGVEGPRRLELLMLLAENKLNMGDVRGAEALFAEARQELPDAVEHEGRIFLRSGRLAEAKILLQRALSAEAGSTKSHREAALVLSLIESLLGEPESAFALATQARERARSQQATWTEAVALIRQGHACLVWGRLDEAEAQYREAIALAGVVGVGRLKAESWMGLALVAGRRGDLAEAETFAKNGLEVAQASGDAWLSAMLSLALGAVYAEASDPRAERWLMQAQTGYERCQDTYGLALCALWFARLAGGLKETRPFLARLRTLVGLVARGGYASLLLRGTLLGLRDEAEAQGFASEAIARGFPRASLPQLEAWGLAESSAPREDALRIHTFGGFRVRHGAQELGERSWGREKARQLFHLFLVFRGTMLPKARIIDLLWPDLDPDGADGTFRVVLNALNKALEPDRKGGSPARFILRQGTSYGLAAHDEVWIDAAAFEHLLDSAADLEEAGEDPTEGYRQALELYEGEFLADYPQYEAWCERERERLADRFASGCLHLARLLSRREDHAGSVHWAQRLLERDPCAEEAWRLVMTGLYRQGDRPGALRAYERCETALAAELDVPPMPETADLYARIQGLTPLDPEVTR